jgi:hypothetical protein
MKGATSIIELTWPFAQSSWEPILRRRTSPVGFLSIENTAEGELKETRKIERRTVKRILFIFTSFLPPFLNYNKPLGQLLNYPILEVRYKKSGPVLVLNPSFLFFSFFLFAFLFCSNFPVIEFLIDFSLPFP